MSFSKSFRITLCGALAVVATPADSWGGTEIKLYDGRVSDVAFSVDGKTVYASTGGGQISAIDIATQSITHTWSVGDSLGGIDVSKDGRFLFAAETLKSNGGALGRVMRLDLTTGSVSTASYNSGFYEGGSFDIAGMADGKALFTTDFLGSGQTSLRTVDFDAANEKFSQFGLVGQRSALTSDFSGTKFLIGEANVSDARLSVFTQGSGITQSFGGYSNGVSGYNKGIQAYSTTVNLAANFIYNQLPVYDAELNYKFDLVQRNPSLAQNVTGMTFSHDGSYLFIMMPSNNSILAYNTRYWSIEQTYLFSDSLPDWFDQAAGWTSSLVAGPNNDQLAVMGRNGLFLLNTGLGGPAPIPEPATWAMMIIGFGAVGNSLRRSKRVNALQRV